MSMNKRLVSIFILSKLQGGALGGWLIFKIIGSTSSAKPLFAFADTILIGTVLYVVMVVWNLINYIQDRGVKRNSP
jgi:hypothetical protein